MGLETTAKYDFSNIIDPTIELWSIDDHYRQLDGHVNEPTVNFWFTAKELDFDYKVDLPLREPLSTIEVVSSTSAADLSSASQNDISLESELDYSTLVKANEFWNFQESLFKIGIQDATAIIAKDFFELQNTTLSSGLYDCDLIAFRDFWKVEKAFAFTGLQDSALVAANRFLSTQELVLCIGLSDNSATFSKEFWDSQRTTSFYGLDEFSLVFFREFFKVQEQSLMSRGIDDLAVSFSKNFWKAVNETTVADNINDQRLMNFRETWKTQNCLMQEGFSSHPLLAAKESRGDERNRLEADVFSEINKCFDLCNGSESKVKGDDVASLKSLRTNISMTLQRKELNLEMTNRFKDEEHSKEVNGLRNLIQDLQKEKSQWINCQKTMAKGLAQKDKQLEVVDEMISHNVDLEFANDELNFRWTQTTARLDSADRVENENLKLISVNDKLVSEKQDLISRFTKTQEELITSNANLHAIVLSMEKAAERHFDESRQLENTIEVLRKDKYSYPQRLNSSPINGDTPSSTSSSGTARAKGPRRRSFSKRYDSNPLRRTHGESNLIPPPSAGMIYVNS